MATTQRCAVCGTAGWWTEGRIEVAAEPAEGPPRIAQCPRCHRFVCEDHAEPLRLSAEGRRVRFGGLRVMGCPFDPDVPLGEAAGPR